MHSGDMIFVATVMLLAPIGLSIYLVCCWKKIVGRMDGSGVEGTVQQTCGSTLPTTRCQGATTR